MKKRKAISFVIAAVVVVALIVIGFSVLNPHASGQVTNSANSNQANSGKTLFSQSSYYQYSYQIFPGTLNSEAKQAIVGFNLQIQNNSDGSTTINLVAVNPEYKTQTYTVKPGQKVYFIERSLRDDSDNNERFLGDDMAVVVDSSGYIIQGPGSA